MTYNAHAEEKTAVLERQRSGPRVVATLEAAGNVLAVLSIYEFQVSARGYQRGH